MYVGYKGVALSAKISLRSVEDILFDILYISTARACRFL